MCILCTMTESSFTQGSARGEVSTGGGGEQAQGGGGAPHGGAGEVKRGGPAPAGRGGGAGKGQNRTRRERTASETGQKCNFISQNP